MSIIGQVEKHNWKVKILNISIHALLIIGSATMVYPLLLMLSGSVKSNVDFSKFTIIPKFIHEDVELFQKYLTTKYNNSPKNAFISYKEPNATIDTILPPDYVSEPMMKDYHDFLNTIKADQNLHFWRCMAMTYEQGVDTYTVRAYRDWLKKKYGKGKEGLAKLNKEFGTEYSEWNALFLTQETFFPRRSLVNFDSGIPKLIYDFKMDVCTDDNTSYWPDIDGTFIEYIQRECTRKLDDINKKLHTNYNSWSDIALAETVPAGNPRLAELWSGFVKTQVNPAFLKIDSQKATQQWRAFLLKKYKNFESIQSIYGGQLVWKSIDDITLDETVPPGGTIRTDYMDFLMGNSTVASLWNKFLKKKYLNTQKLSAAWGKQYKAFSDVPDIDEFAPLPADLPEQAKMDYIELQKQIADNRTCEIPADAIHIDTLPNRYRTFLTQKFASPAEMDKAYGNGFASFDDIPLTEFAPGESNLQNSNDWTEFVNTLEPEEIGLNRQAATEYKNFIIQMYTEKGVCDFELLGKDYNVTVTSMNEVPAYNKFPANKIHQTDKAREDYVKIIQSGKFDQFFRISDTVKYQKKWTEFLNKKYVDVAALNKKWNLTHSSFASVPLPSKMYDWHCMQTNRSELIKEYLKRNYLMVFDTLFMNGNAAVNTLIYCFLAVFAALIVNPLCAYGLSRYKPAPTYKILLFLMLPMAFPAMVLGIPQFLLIKNFGLLNTFACLILPGMANGYSIFLLKGFFDSLPKELFESAALDGASEWTVFWNIGMALSTPILSVIALGAFTGAYANFMLAFLMCQKESMWTMMVYLYQLQQRASQSVGFAALIIAAIPTLLVFIFCQNIIIKGIVVPTEK